MGKLSLRVAGIGAAALALVGCQASLAYVSAENEFVKVLGRGFVISSTRLKSTIAADEITVMATKPGAVCDVSCDIVYDSNDNGRPGDPGDVARRILTMPGEFKGHRFKKILVSAHIEVSKAYFVVRGRKCSDTKVRVIAVFEINSDGLTPRPGGIQQTGPAVAFCTDSTRPHFLECRVVGPNRNTAHLTVGDLAGVRSPLHELYAQTTSLPAPDFLGAAVFVDDQFLAWLSGPVMASIALPVRHGRLGRVQVVTLDRSLNIVGNWKLGDVRF